MKICGSEEETFSEILLPSILWWRLMERMDTTLIPKSVLLYGNHKFNFQRMLVIIGAKNSDFSPHIVFMCFEYLRH